MSFDKFPIFSASHILCIFWRIFTWWPLLLFLFLVLALLFLLCQFCLFFLDQIHKIIPLRIRAYHIRHFFFFLIHRLNLFRFFLLNQFLFCFSFLVRISKLIPLWQFQSRNSQKPSIALDNGPFNLATSV